MAFRAPGSAFLLGLLLLVLSALPVSAQTLQARSAEHDGFARLVFTWDIPVRYAAQIKDGKLLVAFNESVSLSDIKGTVKAISAYVSGVSVASNGRTMIFPLKGSFKLRHFTSGSSVVVDLMGKPSATPKPQAADGVKPTAKPAAKPSDTVPSLTVRVGEHADFIRLVFDWKKPVDYSLDQGTGSTKITFRRPARIEVNQVRRDLPASLKGFDATTGDKSLTVTLPAGKGARINHFRSGNKVVVDVRPAAGGAPPQTLAEKPPASAKPTAPSAPPTEPGAPIMLTPQPEAPPPTKAEPAPTPTPAPTATPNADPQAPLAAPVGPQISEVTLGSEPDAPLPDGAPVAAGEAPPEDPAAPTGPRRVVSMGFPWDKPTAAAVFRRSGYLWVVFDRYQEVDLKLIKKLAGEAVISLDQLPHSHATAIRVVTEPGYNPSLRRDGLMWIVDLMRQPLRAKVPIKVDPQLKSAFGPRIYLSVTDGGQTISVVDPEAGDVLKVVPLVSLGHGITPAAGTPDVDLLPTAQGIVAVPKMDGVKVASSSTGVEITNENGLHISPDIEQLMARRPSAPTDLAEAFDIKNWERGGLRSFNKDERDLLQTVADADKGARRDRRLDLARYYFANGFAAEALGVLGTIALDDETVLNKAAFRALRGASNLLMHRPAEAVEDLSHPSLAGNDEAAFWRAAAEATMGSPELQAETMKLKSAVMADYSHRLKFPLALIATEAAIANGDDGTAKNFLDAVDSPDNGPNERAAIGYYTGRLNELVGSFDEAIANWEGVEKSNSRLYRALAAKAKVDLLLKIDRIQPKEAIAGLEKLRFAWRGGDYEFKLLKRLGELYMETGDYGNGLRTFKQLATSFRDHPDSTAITQGMRDAFNKLFLEGGADAIEPVTAIALYDEFRELTPTGEAGDEMVRLLADRLAAVDLLGKAAELLERQVKFRLEGELKARVGARLALVRLLNREPQLTLDALTLSHVANIPPELELQRRHLEARALADLEKTNEAIMLLVNDTSKEGKLLLTEIHWKKKNWPAAAAVLDTVVAKPPRGGALAEGDHRHVLDRAIALTLAQDTRGLAKIRRDFAPFMEGTEYFELFNLLTTPDANGLIDFRRVGEKIKLAEGFQSFMTFYRAKLEQGGLSQIN